MILNIMILYCIICHDMETGFVHLRWKFIYDNCYISMIVSKILIYFFGVIIVFF